MAPPSVFKSFNSVIKLYLIRCVAHLAQFEFEFLRGARVQTSIDLLTVSSLDVFTNVKSFGGKLRPLPVGNSALVSV